MSIFSNKLKNLERTGNSEPSIMWEVPSAIHHVLVSSLNTHGRDISSGVRHRMSSTVDSCSKMGSTTSFKDLYSAVKRPGSEENKDLGRSSELLQEQSAPLLCAFPEKPI